MPIFRLAQDQRDGHLHLGEVMRQNILAMSASTIDRLLRVPPSRLAPGLSAITGSTVRLAGMRSNFVPEASGNKIM
jgi:hypothetical protein